MIKLRHLGRSLSLATVAILPFVLSPGLAADTSPLRGADLRVAVEVYVEGISKLSGYAASCHPEATATDTGPGIALLVDSITAVDPVLAASIPAMVKALDQVRPSGCNDPALSQRLAAGTERFSWVEEGRRFLDSVEISVIEGTPDNVALAGRLSAVADRYAEAQSRALRCIAVTMPEAFVLAYRDWRDLVARARSILETASVPRSLWSPSLDRIDPVTLAGTSTDRAALRQSCRDDTAWETWYSQFRAFSLVSDVQTAIGINPTP